MRLLLILLALLFVFSRVATAQDEPKPEDPVKIQFVEAPKTIEEAISRRKTAEEDAALKLAEAETVYKTATAAADKQLVESLKQLAKQGVASGDLPGAAKAWEAVLEVDARDVDAIEFFKAIGREDKVVTAAKRATGDPSILAIAGRWRGLWGTSGGEINIVIKPDGSVNQDRLAIDNGRLLWVVRSTNEHIQLVPEKDRILVIGWNRNKGRSALNRIHKIDAIPNNVGYVWRVNDSENETDDAIPQPAITPIKIKRDDLANKQVSFYWQKTDWKLFDDGRIFNVPAKRVVPTDAIWKVQDGRLFVLQDDGTTVSFIYDGYLFNGKTILLGSNLAGTATHMIELN